MCDGAGVDSVESGLPGVGKILEVDEQGESFPDLFGHEPKRPIGFPRLSIVERLATVIVSFQSQFPLVFFFIDQDIVQTVPDRQWIFPDDTVLI